MKVKQSIPKELRYSVKDFNNEFPNDDACLRYLADERWPDGMAHCPKCNQGRKHHRVGNRTAFACDHCGHHLYPLKGTIFEKSSTPLKTWFYVMYLMGSTRCGISAKQIQRETGVTYKCAWRIFKQIRSILSDDDLQLEGPRVEIDETYMGGQRKGKRGRPMRGDKVKTAVVAIAQRKGKVVAKAVKDTTRDSIIRSSANMSFRVASSILTNIPFTMASRCLSPTVNTGFRLTSTLLCVTVEPSTSVAMHTPTPSRGSGCLLRLAYEASTTRFLQSTCRAT